MKRKIHSRGKWLVRSLALILVGSLTLVAASWIVNAEDEDSKKPGIPVYYAGETPKQSDSPWSGWLVFGGSGADKDGINGISGLSASRVAEYSTTGSGPFFGAMLFFDKDKTYWNIQGLFIDSDEVEAAIFGSAGRVFLTDTGINRYLHRLDNDLAADWQGASVYRLSPDSADVETEITVTNFHSFNRLKIPALKGTTVVAHIRMLARGGDRQARTINHCTTCHVTAVGQNMEQRTTELAAGGELAISPVALSYRHVYRVYDDSSQSLSHNYINYFGNFDLEGVQPFAVAPDNKHDTKIGAARIDVGASASAIVKGRISSTTNEVTGHSLDSKRFSGIATFRPLPALTLKGRYDMLEWTSDVPAASERDVERLEGTAVYRPNRQLRLEGSYRREEINRSGGTEVGQTVTKSYRIKGAYRPDRKLRLIAAWRHADVKDPYGRVLRNSFSRIDSVLLSPFGTDEDEFESLLTYSPAAGRTITASYRWRSFENSSVNLEATTQNFALAGHMTAGKTLGFFGRLFFYDNDVERDVYLGVLAPLLEIRSVPYNGRGASYEIGAYFYPSGKFSLRPSYTLTKAESGFGDANLGSGIASAIDATIRRASLESEVGITEKFDLLLMYFLEDYSDDNLPFSDGAVHWFYGGLIYKF